METIKEVYPGTKKINNIGNREIEDSNVKEKEESKIISFN